MAEEWPTPPAGKGYTLADAVTGEFVSAAVRNKLSATLVPSRSNFLESVYSFGDGAQRQPELVVNGVFEDGDTGSPYRPLHVETPFRKTDTADPYTNVYQGLTSTVEYGDSTHAAVGTVHASTMRMDVLNSPNANSEHATYFGFLRYQNGAKGRGWFTDWFVHGSIATQQAALNGITMGMNNYYNGSPATGPSGAIWAVTKQGTGAGTTAAHAAATTYAVDVGIGVVGTSSSASGIGFTTALKIGGIGSGWAPASKFGTGIEVRDWVDFGLRFSQRKSGASGPAIVVEAGQGFVGIGMNAPTAPLEIEGSAGAGNALRITNGQINLSSSTATDAAFRTSRNSGDSTGRFTINISGLMEWGPGTAGRDTVIRRGGVGFMEVPMRVKNGVPSDADFDVTPQNGTLAINSATSKIYARIGGSWVQVTT